MKLNCKTAMLAALCMIAIPAAKAQNGLITQKVLSADVELEAAQAAIDACAAQNIHVHSWVMDAYGNARVLLIGDGAAWDTVSGARRKAYAAVMLGRPTIEIQKEHAANPSKPLPNDPMMLFLGGGVPVRVDGQVIGSISVGGGTPEQDAGCAQAGLNKIMHYLQ